ncbi:synaptopodin-2 isoform X1 [Alligator mississippiensis]|uniref:synaptopodin-2 isoform X1 n=2 Tax=Alligator mississippiensis TaxID=8496 RepID=UPI000711D3F1|nr:synaptopodin-2 isoform X1 [Alligator mississippiensis]
MGTGDYICITMSGGAPWGFRLQGGKEQKQPLQIAKVRSKSKAAKAGLCEGDEVVSINGKSCADLTYSEVISLMEDLADSLQMLIKRSSSGINETLSPETENGKQDNLKNEDYRESTTLQISTTKQMPHQEFYITGIHSAAHHGAEESDMNFFERKQEKETAQSHKITPKVIETSKVLLTDGAAFRDKTEERRPGALLELQLSLSHDRHKDTSAPVVTVFGTEKCSPSETGLSVPQDGTSPVTAVPLGEKAGNVQWSSKVFQIASGKEVKTSQGAEAGEPFLTRVEVILDCTDREKEVSRSVAEKGCVDSQVEGGQSEAPPSVVSFGISSEGTEQGEDDQHSERDHSKPLKHRARHSRLRRGESLSEKQVKEAKSKCKSIALLLTAAPNPNSKGVLMFKKRRQRARKYTLVSYGTGELQRDEDEGEEGEGEEGDKENTFEVTLLGTSESEIDEDFFSDIDNEGKVVTFDWDTGLLEVEKKTKSGDEMQALPETKGKGVLMFAKRRQRMDQITAEQEEMKSRAVHTEERREASTTESLQKMSSSSYHTRETESSRMKSCVSKSYIEMGHSHGKMIQQNGIGGAEASISFQSSEAQKAASLNRTAKPFPGVQNRIAAPFSPTRNVTSPLSDLPAPPPYSSVSPPPDTLYRPVSAPVASRAQPAVWSPTEQIASRDERIAVPAKRTGILQEAKRRSTAKPMFTFKEPPKVSPNPALLSLVQHAEGKRGTGTGFESGPEEDYLSLGAEACNFMQIQASKQKTPPPVAPKPSVKVSPTAGTPISPVWSPPAVVSTQPPSFPTPNSSQAAGPPPVRAPQPAYHPPQPPSTLNLVGPFKGPQAAVASQNYTPKTPTTPIAGGMGPAFEMPPALSGKGAQLFAKRQSRMEKYVVDSETVQANLARASSPTPSLPASWKYSSNVRAPPPVAYNPIHSPFYPPAATKPQSKSTAATKSTKRKPKKVLNALEVMKHQPYQLNASLFTFQPPSDTKEGLASKQSKFSPMPASKQVLSSRPLNAGSPTNVQASSVYSVPTYTTQPWFQSNVSTPVNESYAPVGHSTYSKSESVTSSLLTAPRPKFSAKKVGVTAQERSSGRSLSLPGRPSSLTPRATSPSFPVIIQPAPDYFSKPPGATDRSGKRLTPWEAAAKSPLGLVDDAFGPQNIQESIVANVVSAARRKTLPEPPDDWKQRVSYEPPAPSIHASLASFGKRQSGIISPPKSTMSAPSSTSQCGTRLQYAYYGQRSQIDPDMMSMDTRSDYGLLTPDLHYNPHPRGWRHQT